jgi:hypothetical protein
MKKPSALRKVTITVEWYCGFCHDGREDDVSPDAFYTSGGCQGHGPDEYCYCSSAEVRISVTCDKCQRSSDFLMEDH